MSEIKRYWVHGKLYWTEHCECEHCRGHEGGKTIDLYIDCPDITNDPRRQLEAHRLVLKQLKLYLGSSDCEWEDVHFDLEDDPEVTRLLAERSKRALGPEVAPPLFDTDFLQS